MVGIGKRVNHCRQVHLSLEKRLRLVDCARPRLRGISKHKSPNHPNHLEGNCTQATPSPHHPITPSPHHLATNPNQTKVVGRFGASQVLRQDGELRVPRPRNSEPGLTWRLDVWVQAIGPVFVWMDALFPFKVKKFSLKKGHFPVEMGIFPLTSTILP